MVFNYSGVASLFMLRTQDLYILQDTFWNASVNSFHILFFSSLNWASFSFKTFSSCNRVTEAQNNSEISLDVLAKIKREAKHMNSIKKKNDWRMENCVAILQTRQAMIFLREMVRR